MDANKTNPAETAPFADARTAWVISDGTRGMEVQSIGLAERMQLAIEVIRLEPGFYRRFPKLALLPLAPLPRALAQASKNGWPDVVITTGKRMAGLSMLVRRRSRGKTRSIHIQDPKLPAQYFDWMVVPSHDRLRGENVLVTTGSLNALTPERIGEASQNLPEVAASLRSPLIVFMIGGSNRRYKVHWPDYFKLGEFAGAIAHATEASLAFIPSRRSLEEAGEAIRTALKAAKSSPAFYIWDGEDDNPYPGILGRATAVVVTSDSVNMTSEACLSGKPVYSYNFREESGRIALFHKILKEGGYTRDSWDLQPYTFPESPGPGLDEAGRIAAILTGRRD